MPPPPYPKSPHFDGQRFFNEDIGGTPQPRRVAQLLRWKLGSARRARIQNPWPDRLENTVFAAPPTPGPGEIVITWIGHASFLIQFPGLTVIIDPHFSQRCSPVPFLGPRRVRAPGLSLQGLPPIDVILISHNHYDHADLPSLRALHARHAPPAVTLLGNASLLAAAGLCAHQLDWWEATRIGNLSIAATPARHFSRRRLFDGNRALWGGFLLRHPAGSVFFAGDSGMGPHWGEIADRHGAPHLALLPIGAYAPRWLMAPVHMNPEEAVQAHITLKPRQSIGMHFGTFRLTDEPIDEPVEQLAAICAAQAIPNFDVMQTGESRVFAFPRSNAACTSDPQRKS